VTKTLTILGFGSQAQAWCANLKAEGWDLQVILRPESPSWSLAQELKLKVLDTHSPDLASVTQLALLAPDHLHLEILKDLAPQLSEKTLMILAHGYSHHAFNLPSLFPQLRFGLLAPKAIASELSARKIKKQSLAAVWFSNNDLEVESLLFEIMKDLGITYQVKASFEEETKADLFSEQTILCSLLPYGSKLAFDHLVKKGINPELAFIECWMELKLIADAMVERGPEAFFKLISPNALIGSSQAREILLGNDYQAKLDGIYENIESEEFYQQCQSISVDEHRRVVLDEWKQSQLQKTFEQLKELVSEKERSE
jgi:ketol-acid reductoisomerase